VSSEDRLRPRAACHPRAKHQIRLRCTRGSVRTHARGIRDE
jgi:hypothetical protein